MKFHCIVLITLGSVVAHAQGDEPSAIGYPTVAAALAALKSEPSAEIREQDGWTVVTQELRDSYVLWSFTPADHPAHPAAVKRTVVERDGAIYIDMQALCAAAKDQCDKLIEEFHQLNEQIRQSITGGT